MIHVRYLGQLGNQMFQYCIGHILAARTKQLFVPGPFVDKTGRPLAQSLFRPMAAGHERNGVGDYEITCEHWFNLDDVAPGWNLHVQGFFQRYEFYRPYKNRIRESWLKLQQPFVETDLDAVYVHVRRTDYLGDDLTPERNCQATTIDEYLACMARFETHRAVLVSDDYRDPFLADLATALTQRFGIEVSMAQGTWQEDFMTLASCRRMVMSQSTFSWWAGFLGHAEKIVCPVFANTFWGKGFGAIGGRFPDLFVDDEPGRWEWVIG